MGGPLESLPKIIDNINFSMSFYVLNINSRDDRFTRITENILEFLNFNFHIKYTIDE